MTHFKMLCWSVLNSMWIAGENASCSLSLLLLWLLLYYYFFSQYTHTDWITIPMANNWCTIKAFCKILSTKVTDHTTMQKKIIFCILVVVSYRSRTIGIQVVTVWLFILIVRDLWLVTNPSREFKTAKIKPVSRNRNLKNNSTTSEQKTQLCSFH